MYTKTGILGLDEILGGGLSPRKTHLVAGGAGTGKTTLGLHFACEGATQGERVVFVALSETRTEIEEAARWYGWSPDGVTILERSDIGGSLVDRAGASMFHPSEVELGQTVRRMLEMIDEHRPTRVVLDSLAEIRVLAHGELQFRRQILELKDHFLVRGRTVLLLDDVRADAIGSHLQSIAHGVILLEQVIPRFGPERRLLKISKLRTQHYASGHHDYEITRNGIRVFPRLVPVTRAKQVVRGKLSSHVEALDALLGGGLQRGTSTLLIGPSGTGKSSVALRFAVAAAERGERASLLLFDEGRETLVERAEQLGMALAEHIESGAIGLHELDPVATPPGAVAQLVRSIVESTGDTSMVVVDSLSSYLDSVLRREDRPELHLYEMLVYLAKQGVATLLVQPQLGVLGQHMETPVETSYMVDTMLLFRYFEWHGELRRTLSVVKQRTGGHETTVRELMLGPPEGLKLGPALKELEGVLMGNPRYVGDGGARSDGELVDR